ncbi:uncharacterized protein LOC131882360 [Tigriopus californicus]|uniref:uncharacterized protein LOC131882360 n=1 Tax=Tigriopus californicus TaxID=6832 RepID=UPI0027DA6F93|nr:uncharacterized protein LOC131882360 [Tigriopus californicus]
MDHFQDIFEPAWVRNAHVGGLLLFHVLGTYLLMSVNRFEEERTTHRTIIHSLTKFLHLLPIIHNMTRFNIDVARVLFGPLPDLLCMTSIFSNMFISIVALLAFNEIMVLRYLYICVWKHVGKLNDEFFSVFLTLANVGLAGLFSLMAMASQNYYVFHYGVCKGEDPTIFVTKFSPFPTTLRMPVILCISTGFVHCVLYTKIVKVKVKIMSPSPTTSLPLDRTLPMWWANEITNSSGHHQIIKEVGQNVLMVLLILASLLPGLIARQLNPKQDLYQKTSIRLLIISPSFVVPLVHSLIFPMTYILRHPQFLNRCLGLLWY